MLEDPECGHELHGVAEGARVAFSMQTCYGPGMRLVERGLRQTSPQSRCLTGSVEENMPNAGDDRG